jgi:hypothetical protein
MINIHKSYKKFLLILVYGILALVIGCIIYLDVTYKIEHKLYGYTSTGYNHELDSFFRKDILSRVDVSYVYKSRKHGSLYLVKLDTLANISIIEALNYKGIQLKDVEIIPVEKIDLTKGKTYTTIYYYDFPIIQQMVNPKQTVELKIFFERPVKIDSIINKEKLIYIKGDFDYVSFGNTQYCSIISFQKKLANEIIILKQSDKIYFIVQTTKNVSLQEILNDSRWLNY